MSCQVPFWPMARRPYVQRARAKTAAATRARIIAASRRLLVRDRVPRLELAELAKEAGVARSTIYAAFGSAGGLISAVTEDSLRRAGFERLRELFSLPDPVEALTSSLEYSVHVYSADHDVVSRLLLLAAIDTDAAALYVRTQSNRAAGMRDIANRLHRAGQLRQGQTVESAAAVLWLLTSFETFDQLYSGWHLSPEACAEQMVRVARGVLLAE